MPGAELELTVVDGHPEATIPSRVRLDEGPHGVRFVAETDEPLGGHAVRERLERDRH